MPVCKAEAHLALELLEDYHSRLDEVEERELKLAIERVIKIFKSRLFQALLEIQEFYEITLMDDGKTYLAKAAEANSIANKWDSGAGPFVAKHQALMPAAAQPPQPQPVAPLSGLAHSAAVAKVKYALSAASDPWEFEDIVLERGGAGLGFTIAGGIDNPHLGNDNSIFITKVIDGGAAAVDGRLKVEDIILKVNDVSVVNVSHSVAVEALKRAGNRVSLKVKRKKPHVLNPDDLIEVDLQKGSKGLGFTIAGGIGNQHIPGDNGIYVTKVMDGGAAAQDGRIAVGDRLVAVKNLPGGDFFMDNCTHEEAVSALKRCRDKITLVVSKAENVYPSSPTIGQIQSCSVQSVMLNRPLARSVSEEELSGPRQVSLQKTAAGLGFNIVGGEGGEGIFVSFILAGGPADVCGQVRRGDRILMVNGMDLSSATHEEAALALKNAGSVVHLALLYRPDEYEKFEEKVHSLKNQIMSGSMIRMSEKKSLYVRALFDYDPKRDDGVPSKGLSFLFGDILYVTNASDEDWWQAKKLDSSGRETETGIIPSKMRWEKRLKSREKNVRWDSRSARNSLRKHSSNKRLPFIRSKEDDSHHSEGEMSQADSLHDSRSLDGDSTPPIYSYELVQEVEIDYTRPVVILGPAKDRINDDLISEFPEKFGSCVPHTTRPQRQLEVNGRDYHFVASRKAMELDIQNHKFIEAGQYNGNLYGTSVASVKEVAERGKHCILDVSGNAIKRLQTARLYPIAVFIKPKSAAFIAAVTDPMAAEQADKMYQRAIKTQHDFLPFFTAVVCEDTYEDVYEAVKLVIKTHSKSSIWVPANDML